jgi:hypothetical protein
MGGEGGHDLETCSCLNQIMQQFRYLLQ